LADGSKSGSGEGGLPLPLVLECDLSGEKLEMSSEVRQALGRPGNLREAVAAVAQRTNRVAFDGVLENSGRVWISSRPPMERHDQRKASLSNIQANLMRHYFHLKAIEDRLSAQALRKKKGVGGAAAIRQIERERSRLGRELHTGVGQMLAAISLQLDAITSELPDPPARVGQSLSRISSLSQEALEEVRALSRNLHPPEWQRLSLKEAVGQLWEVSGIPQRFAASLEFGELPDEVPLELKVMAYRTAQEAFSNIIRHSQARRVEAWLGIREGRLVLRVKDDGVGFDAERQLSAAPHIGSGIGLRSTREQAEALSGEVVVVSGAHGTTLELSAPLADAT
jgi:signal transduction histidine kinase